jgi:transcriptional regulator with XRE-family HTH domain
MSKKTEDSFHEELKIRFAKRLSEAVGDESNLSFSKKCGLSDSLLGRYIRGDTFPTISKLQDIAKASGRSMGWLLGEYDDEELEQNNETCNEDNTLLNQWVEIFNRMTHNEREQVIGYVFRHGFGNILSLTASQEVDKVAELLNSLPSEDRREILERYVQVERSGATNPQGPVVGKKAG